MGGKGCLLFAVAKNRQDPVMRRRELCRGQTDGRWDGGGGKTGEGRSFECGLAKTDGMDQKNGTRVKGLIKVGPAEKRPTKKTHMRHTDPYEASLQPPVQLLANEESLGHHEGRSLAR